jgi:DNA-binding IclR family transcriptional regulator
MTKAARKKPPRESAVRSILRATSILDAFRDRPSIGVTELAQALDLHKSTVHRLLATLEEAGYVTQDLQNERYSLGLKVFDLARSCLPQQDLRAHALPVMQRLMQKTGETVILGILMDLQVVCIETVVSPRPISIGRLTGMRVHPHVSSMGKAILAHLDPGTTERLIREKGLPRLTARTITSPEAFRRHLDQVRQLGYAVNDEEEDVGLKCLATPIRNRARDVVAALSVAGPAPRFEKAAIERFAVDLRAASEEISSALGYAV